MAPFAPDIRAAIDRATTDKIGRIGAFDAIVIGGGAAGGLAAELLTKGGLSVLLLDAGGAPRSFLRSVSAKSVAMLANPNALPFMPPSLLYKGRRVLRIAGRLRQPVQTDCYAWDRAPALFVDDVDNPYTTPPGRPFTWIRARTLGGRLAIPGHGRQYFRFGPDEFHPRDGRSPPWPFVVGELDPWYSFVEQRISLAGRRERVANLPDSLVEREIFPTHAEQDLIGRISRRWPNASPVMGRFADPPDTIAVAARTGRLAVRRNAVARKIETIGAGRVEAVTWMDATSGEVFRTRAPIVFLCASCLESSRILMISDLGGPSKMLGQFLMDHVMLKIEGIAGPLPGEAPVRLEDGRNIYLPRFDLRDGDTNETRGFGVQVYRNTIARQESYFTAVAFSEMLPRAYNRARLDPIRRDRLGLPVLHIDCAHGIFERGMAAKQAQALRELAELANVKVHQFTGQPSVPGAAVHETGTARMGSDPTQSVLDPYNQCWAAQGLYVTDSSSFVSQGSQNPTLTLMALTARACDRALRSH